MGVKEKILKAVWDAGMVAGAAAAVYGLWLAWHPLGFIVGGLLAAAGCFFGGYQEQRSGLLNRSRS
jgi:hypothetical protein